MPLGTSGLVDPTATKLLFHRITTRQTDREVMLHPVIAQMLRQTRAFRDLTRGMNATAVQYGDIDLSSAVAAATAEGALPAATTFTPTVGTFAPSRQAAYWLTSDNEAQNTPALAVLAQVAGLAYGNVDRLAPGEVGQIAMVVEMCMSVINNWIIDQVKAILPSATTSIGTPGAHMTWAQWKSGIKARRDAGVRGAGLDLVHRTTWDSIEGEIVSAGGAGANSRVAINLADRAAEDTMYPAMYSNVDVAVVSGLATAGADTVGGIVFPGALHLDIHSEEPIGSRRVVLATEFFKLYEIGYNGGSQAGFEMVFYACTEIVRQAAMLKHPSKTAV